MTRPTIIACSLVAGALAVAAPSPAPSPAARAEQHYQAGLDQHNQADLATRTGDAHRLYAGAIAEYQAATRAEPMHYRAQLCWAVCLGQLCALEPDPDRAQQHLIEANQRFAIAAECPGADYAVFDQWSYHLLGNILALVEGPADRSVILRETIRVCQSGLDRTREAAPRAHLERRLADALGRLADLLADPVERDALRQQGAEHRRRADRILAAQRRYETGLDLQNRADCAPTPEQARQLYQAAIREYEAATVIHPEQYASHLAWAVSLNQLAVVSATTVETRTSLIAAHQRFASAAECPGADQTVFEQWANLLLGNMLAAIAEIPDRVALLRETARVCERGLRLASVPTPHARIERHLGRALLLLAETSPAPADQETLLHEAVTHLRAASQSIAVRQEIHQDGSLGVALLGLGRLRQDPGLLREAVAEFTAALQVFPNQPEFLYRLAAAWSMLGELDRATQHLAAAIDHDPQGEMARRAAHDSDLAALRASPAYAAAINRRRRQAAETEAVALHRQALDAWQQTDRTTDRPELTGLLRQAEALCRQAIALTPDHYPSQSLHAAVLVRLARQASDSIDADQARLHREAADARFAAAAQCAEAEPGLFDQWAGFLLEECLPRRAEPAAQETLLTKAREVLERGLSRARFTGLRSRLESRLGICLVRAAELEAPEAGPAVSAQLRRTAALGSPTTATRYAEAIKHFRAAETAGPGAPTAETCEFWGLALLRQGQAAKDKMLIRQAIERFARGLEAEPDHPALSFNLACAYAQVHQFDQATRYLQQCLQRDPHGRYQARAETDPDLRALRQTDAVRRLLRLPATAPATPRATISGR